MRGGETTQTLEITMKEPVLGFLVKLLYTVFPAEDVIVRMARMENSSDRTVYLEKAAGMCIDFPGETFDVIHFHGRHNSERTPQRLALPSGVFTVGSRRGMSSHQHNPFVILCGRSTTEMTGSCYGIMHMFSGNHLEEFEVDQFGMTRAVAGVHPDRFNRKLDPGQSFDTPQVILSFSDEGLNSLSDNYHRLIRSHVIPERFRDVTQPVLINSWEAMYFNFNAEKLVKLAASAKELGIGMLVLDDGWFGKRDDDTSGLGDWTVNEEKLGCSMKELARRVNDLGLKFGLWIEPEMISEDSELFREHPDWMLCDPGRKPVSSRNQFVLDMARPDVVEYLYSAISAILNSANIEYIKWDFNRSVENVFSGFYPADRQGEVSFDFVKGTYELLRRLTESFPQVLFEGCAGGGGRFDAGMLFYCPQIWCSDDTDPIERLVIQRGTSYGYPVCTMGAHVSASPNHQTGRRTPFSTRAAAALSGTFGYELDPARLPEEEQKEIRKQVADYYRFNPLIRGGRYYRLTELSASPDFEAWMFVSQDKKEALLCGVCTHVRGSGPALKIKLAGLEPEAEYCLEGSDACYTGAALMYGGFVLPAPRGDYPSAVLHFTVKDR